MNIRLCDFGIGDPAKAGMVVGGAPEVVGATEATEDVRPSDVWVLGCLFLRLANGGVLFVLNMLSNVC